MLSRLVSSLVVLLLLSLVPQAASCCHGSDDPAPPAHATRDTAHADSKDTGTLNCPTTVRYCC
jgi:hypothetical protein